MEQPIYVNCLCHDCGHKWESEAFVGKCPLCDSNNINQNVMMRGL